MNRKILIVLFTLFTSAGFGQVLKQTMYKTVNYDFNVKKESRVWEDKIIPSFMIVMGAGMVGIWTMDIASGKFKNQGNFFEWKNDAGDYMWTHISAEYITGISLITSGVSMFADKDWAVSLSMVSLGALAYTSLNNLGWTFVDKNRYGYAVPMAVGLTGSVISIIILL